MRQPTRNVLTLSVFLSLICLHQVSYAKERWYQVELMVIEHKNQEGISLEEWPTNPGEPNMSYVFAPHQSDDASGQFIRLNDDELELKQAEESLVTRTGSRVILHTGWRQTLAENEQTPIRLTSPLSYPINSYRGQEKQLPALDGTLTLLRSRYLHVKSDLIFHEPVLLVSQDTDSQKNQTQRVKPLDSTKNWQYRSDVLLKGFRLQAFEKLKKGELVYLDHPAFGVLIKISDAKAPKSES